MAVTRQLAAQYVTRATGRKTREHELRLWERKGLIPEATGWNPGGQAPYDTFRLFVAALIASLRARGLDMEAITAGISNVEALRTRVTRGGLGWKLVVTREGATVAESDADANDAILAAVSRGGVAILVDAGALAASSRGTAPARGAYHSTLSER